MSVSNKTLSVLLLAAIVVSLGGTFISLNKLGTLTTTGYQVSGENATGTIDLSVDEKIEITLADRDIDFGTCELGVGSAGITVNTEGTEATTNCTGWNGGAGTVYPIIVQNTGNVNVLVNIEVNDTDTQNGGNFLNISTSGANSAFQYQTIEHGTENGCTGLNNTYAAFTVANSPVHHACTDLQPNNNADKFLTHFQLGVPDNAQGSSNVLVTFVATKV